MSRLKSICVWAEAKGNNETRLTTATVRKRLVKISLMARRISASIDIQLLVDELDQRF
jgi:hypothetical protein